MKYDVKIALLISFVIYLFLQFNSEIYFRRKSAELSTLSFDWQFGKYGPDCVYQWRQFSFKLQQCNSLVEGQKYRLIGRVEGVTDKFGFHTKKLAIQSISPLTETTNSVNARTQRKLLELEKARTTFLEKVNGLFLTPDQKIMAAVLTGDKSQLSLEQHHLIEVTGMQHAFAVSGQHLSIILSAVRPHLRRFWGYKSDPPLVVLAWIATWMVGSSASMVRAALTVTISIVVKTVWRRPINSFQLLSVVATMMLTVNPWWLTDIGFQLTFAAMVGVLIAQPLVGAAQHWTSNFSISEDEHNDGLSFFSKMSRYIRETVIVTSIITLLVAPLTVWHFQSFSLLSVPTNVAVLWLFPSILASAGLLICLNLLLYSMPALEIVISPFASFAELPTSITMAVLAWFSQFDLLFISLTVTQFRVIVIYYLLVLLIWRLFVKRTKKNYHLVY